MTQHKYSIGDKVLVEFELTSRLDDGFLAKAPSGTDERIFVPGNKIHSHVPTYKPGEEVEVSALSDFYDSMSGLFVGLTNGGEYVVESDELDVGVMYFPYCRKLQSTQEIKPQPPDQIITMPDGKRYKLTEVDG